MLKLIALSLALVSGTAVANDTVLRCNKQGYTADAELFHNIHVSDKPTVFNVYQNEVLVGNERYVLGDASRVDLSGTAVTYYSPNFHKVLYLYVNENGDREIGISAIEPDSDTLFQDKTVYQDCGFEGVGVNGSTAQVLRTNSRTNTGAGALYVF
ncbi:hypothetical protein D3C79_49090 [compost metagenome]